MNKLIKTAEAFEKIWKEEFPDGFLTIGIEAMFYSIGDKKYTAKLRAYKGTEDLAPAKIIKNTIIFNVEAEDAETAENILIDELVDFMNLMDKKNSSSGATEEP